MTYPTYTTPRSIPGAATPTYLNASLVSGYFAGQSFIVANTTDWYEVSSSGTATTNPLGTSGVFTLVVDYGSGTEEKILCASGAIPIGVNVPISVWTDGTYNGRGWDGTTPHAHTSGTNSNFNVFPVRTAVDDLQFNTAAANSLVSTNPNLGGVTAISGQSAVWNGISWTPATISGGGGITSLTGDVTAIGTGAVAATLVGTTSVSGVVNVIINANSTVTGTVASLATLSGQYVVTSGIVTAHTGYIATISGKQVTDEANIASLSGNLATLSGQYVVTSGSLTTLSGQFVALSGAYATTSGNLNTTNSNLSTLSGQFVTLSGQYVVTSGSLTTLSGQFVTLSGQYNTTSGIVTTATGNIASLSGSLATLSGQYVISSGILTTATGNIANLSGSLATLSGQFVVLSGAYATTSGNLNTTNSNLTSLSGQFATLSGAYNTTSGIVTGHTSSIALISGNLNTLSGQYATTSGIVTTATGNIASLSGSLASLSGQYVSTSGSLTTLSGQFVTLSGSYASTSGSLNTVSGVAYAALPITGGTISGNLTVASGLTVSGSLSVASEVDSGAMTIGGNLTVTGTSTLIGNSTFSGTLTVASAIINPILQGAYEVVSYSGSTVLSGTATPATLNAANSSFYFYNTAPSGTYTVAITGAPTVSGISATFALLVNNGATAYLPQQITINGVGAAATAALPAHKSTTSGITTYYQGGTLWSAADASELDSYTFTVICTSATPTWTLLAGLTKF